MSSRTGTVDLFKSTKKRCSKCGKIYTTMGGQYTTGRPICPKCEMGIIDL